MANTYERIRQVLSHLEVHPADRLLSTVSTAIREARLWEFRLRGDGSDLDDYMSESSISQLIKLMADLGLIGLNDGRLTFRPGDFSYLHDDDAYARKIDQAAKRLMSRRGIPLARVNEAISNIKLPQVPDAPTVYEELGDEAAGMTGQMFAKILSLFACAHMSINRTVHIHYSLS